MILSKSSNPPNTTLSKNRDMRISDWLHDSMIRLHGAGVDSPRRDCLVLVEDLLGKDRAWVLAHHEYKLSQKQLKILAGQLQRRVNREPLAYIREKAWFYGRFFGVTPNVMIPRPESESFIALLKKEVDRKNNLNTIWDIGTGSGCLAITIKKELAQIHVSASDISSSALLVARSNARLHQVNIRFIKSDLLENMPSMPRTRSYAVVANLPYVPHGSAISPEINYEPEPAIFSDDGGLRHYRRLWEQIGKLHNKPHYILAESLKNQHKKMVGLAKAAGYELKKTDLLVQLFVPSTR